MSQKCEVLEGRGDLAALMGALEKYRGRIRQMVAREMPGPSGSGIWHADHICPPPEEPARLLVWTLVIEKA